MRRRLLLLGGVLAAALSVSGPAEATPGSVSGLTQVSGQSPFGSCTADNVAAQSGTNFPNSEVEPWVAVNPTNSNNIVGLFQQDRWSDGGARGLVAGVSKDGGATWSMVVIPKISLCSGGTAADGLDFDRATDPWLSFAPNGDLYAISLSLSHDLRRTALLVSKSTDGGLTWSDPIKLLDEFSEFGFPFNSNDKESITADPTDSNLVYAVWDRARFPSDNADFNAIHSAAFRGDIFFTRTTNAGASWAQPHDVLALNKNQFTIGNQIAVLPSGRLVDIFELFNGSGLQPPFAERFQEAVIISDDKGLTWSKPIPIASDLSVIVRDPDTGAEVRAGAGLPDIAVNPRNGTLSAVWSDGRFSGGLHDDVAFSQSTDGGRTWTAPVRVNLTRANVPERNQQAFTPSVEARSDGTVAVTYYDFRNNTPASGVPTDYWVAHCHSGCTNPASWLEAHVAGPFDIEKAPVARGFFLGDYQGLAAGGGAFKALFGQAGSTPGTSDIFFASATG
jgi:hypothetical protein